MFSNQSRYLQAIAGPPAESGVPDRELFLYQLLQTLTCLPSSALQPSHADPIDAVSSLGSATEHGRLDAQYPQNWGP